MLLESSILLIIGFALLSWSADRFVYGASALARHFGISPMLIGLTIVAMGSSAPEIMAASAASLDGKSNTAIGNAIGSNITNITLVLGVTALLRPLTVSSSALRREMPLVMLVSLLAFFLLQDLYFSKNDGIVLMTVFVLVISLVIWISIRHKGRGDPLEQVNEDEIPKGVPPLNSFIWLIVGMILLPISADILVDSASDIAKYFGMSDLVIGLTVIAIGTSLPELAACIAGVLKNEDDLALGNILGSNMFNILAVLAMPGLINPTAVDPQAISRDMSVMLAATFALIVMSFNFRGSRRINRWEGGLLLLSFIGYQLLLFLPPV